MQGGCGMSGEGKPRILSLCGLAGLAVTLWSAPAAADIASDWAAMSGGLEAKIVYWDGSTTRLTVLDLQTGQTTPIAPAGSYSNGKIPCWSPDGTRIFVRGNGHIIVMDEDGTNAVEETSFTINYNQGGWWNGEGNDRVVALVAGTYPDAIKRYRIDAGNNVVETVTVVDEPYAGAGDGRGYATMSGDYVAWWVSNANQPAAAHRCIIRNWKTPAEYEALPRDESCCGIHLKHDGSGDYIYSYHNHYQPAPVQTFAGTYATRIAEVASVSAEDKWHVRFSNHDDYVTYRDNGALDVMRGWVRKVSDGGYVYLGTAVVDPDLWVQTDTITVPSPHGRDKRGRGPVDPAHGGFDNGPVRS